MVLMNVENTLLLGMVDLCMKKQTSTLAGPVPDGKGLGPAGLPRRVEEV
jgi:hypothetical protein